MTKPVVLCILDGWGLSETQAGNAPALARTPNFDRFMQNCPNATLITHGADAGLPSGQMGNSEVGHTNIGAGRVVAMDLGQIDLAIEDKSFFENPAILDFATKLRANTGALGQGMDFGFHFQVAEGMGAFAAVGRQAIKVAGRGQLHCFQVHFRA